MRCSKLHNIIPFIDHQFGPSVYHFVGVQLDCNNRMLHKWKCVPCFQQFRLAFLSIHRVFLRVCSAFVQCPFCIHHACIPKALIVCSLYIQHLFCIYVYVERKKTRTSLWPLLYFHRGLYSGGTPCFCTYLKHWYYSIWLPEVHSLWSVIGLL